MLTITIGTVDMDGFTGRDLHPKKTDDGRRGIVLSYELTDMADADDPAPVPVGVFKIRLIDNVLDVREVEVIDHEVADISQ